MSDCRGEDGFGDYGVVGVLVYGVSPEAVEIDTFLLSCRVLGRGVEHRMLNYSGEIARERELDLVIATAIPTGKNLPARQFLDSVATEFKQKSEGRSVYRIPATLAATTAPNTEGVTTAAGEEPRPGAPSFSAATPGRIVPPYERIASSLYRPDQVLLQISARGRKRRERPLLDQPPRPPSTATQRSSSPSGLNCCNSRQLVSTITTSIWAGRPCSRSTCSPASRINLEPLCR